MLRGHAGRPDWILVISTRPSRPRRRRNRRVPEGAPTAEVAVSRATLVAAGPIEGDPGRWLAGADLQAEVQAGLAQIERALHLHRIASADPAARGVTLGEALAVRVGYGAGEQVSEGRWTEAVDVGTGSRRRNRRRMLPPEERFAALLGGHDVALASEELALRARSDVDAGRWREAAFQLDAALSAAPGELAPWRNHSDMAGRITELEELAPGVASVRAEAAGGGVSDAGSAVLTGALERLEAALRARSAAVRP